MLPSRLRHYAKNQNWSAIVVELLVVVLGVFIGLQVDNWNQARIEQNTVKSYYDRLIEDLRTNANSFQARHNYYKKAQIHGQSALDALQGSENGTAERLLIDAYQASQMWQMFINRAAFDEILSVGVLNTIPDVDARSRLTNYHSAFDGISPQLNAHTTYRETVRSLIPIEIQRSISTQCGDNVSVDTKGAILNDLRETCDLNLDVAVTDKARTALLIAPQLETQLTRRLADLDLKLAILERNKERSSRLADYLESTKP